MKPHTNSLRQQVYTLLQTAPKPMTSKQIADAMNTTTHELANTLRNMMHDGVNYPDFYRRRNKIGYLYSANLNAPEPDQPRHSLMDSLWRGWGNADQLGEGSDESFFRRMRCEP